MHPVRPPFEGFPPERGLQCTGPVLPVIALPPDAHPLTMRSRFVHDESGSRVESLVMCSLTARVRLVGDCSRCAHHAGGSYRILSGKSESRVLCRQAQQPNPPSSREPIWTLLPDEMHCVETSLSIVAALSLLREKQLAALPVVDMHGHLEGIVSRSELTRPLWKSGDPIEPHTRVAAVMTRQYRAVAETATIADLTSLMTRENLRFVPVVGQENKGLGVLSALDVVRWVAQQDA